MTRKLRLSPSIFVEVLRKKGQKSRRLGRESNTYYLKVLRLLQLQIASRVRGNAHFPTLAKIILVLVPPNIQNVPVNYANKTRTSFEVPSTPMWHYSAFGKQKPEYQCNRTTSACHSITTAPLTDSFQVHTVCSMTE